MKNVVNKTGRDQRIRKTVFNTQTIDENQESWRGEEVDGESTGQARRGNDCENWQVRRGRRDRDK